MTREGAPFVRGARRPRASRCSSTSSGTTSPTRVAGAVMAARELGSLDGDGSHTGRTNDDGSGRGGRRGRHVARRGHRAHLARRRRPTGAPSAAAKVNLVDEAVRQAEEAVVRGARRGGLLAGRGRRLGAPGAAGGRARRGARESGARPTPRATRSGSPPRARPPAPGPPIWWWDVRCSRRTDPARRCAGFWRRPLASILLLLLLPRLRARGRRSSRDACSEAAEDGPARRGSSTTPAGWWPTRRGCWCSFPGPIPRSRSGPAQAAALLADFMVQGQEVETVVRAAKEVEPGRGYVELDAALSDRAARRRCGPRVCCSAIACSGPGGGWSSCGWWGDARGRQRIPCHAPRTPRAVALRPMASGSG